MTDEIELIHSPLSQTYSASGHTLRIHIYRGQGSPWILEIVDERGTSTVWDDPFDSDAAALQEAFVAIEADGIHSFVTAAPQTAGEVAPNMMAPLSDEELEELDQYLLDLDAEEGMTLDMLDGFLHALAIGPETVMPHRWLPLVWGQKDGAMMPPASDLDQLNHILGLVMRHFNSIVSGFEQHPPLLAPCWGTRQTSQGTFEDAETWAYGFTQGVELSQAAWQTLLKYAQGRRWYRPIGLLGADDFSPDQDELTRTPQQRQALTEAIEDSLLQIHDFWLPLRRAVAERQQAQRMSTKVGRNEPCPCGSGKKFKKCCGAPAELH